MFINKMGSYHFEYGINNQDYGFIFDNIKCIVDGCGSSKHSEIGAKLFCKYLKEALIDNKFAEMMAISLIKIIFDKLLRDMNLKDKNEILDYLAFTILLNIENKIIYCGDGFIILIKDNKIKYIELKNNNEYVDYYIYRFLGMDINFIEKKFKDKIMIASDGLRFIIGHEKQKEFESILLEENELKMKLFINKNKNIFKDDITIC
jgi:serine/threonine protein phosphatase PrpC